MKKFVLVTGDFVPTGGMDRANLALATALARRGDEVHLVTHRADPGICRYENVKVHLVPKPLNSYLLGGPFLDRAGRSLARRLSKLGARVVVNGGNCRFGDVNWVHYVHAAWTPLPSGDWKRRIKSELAHRLNLSAERDALKRARLVIVNSKRTGRDVVERIGVAPERVETIYLGVDAQRFRPPTDAERSSARDELGRRDARPIVAFIGALGDLRKGFDTVFAAWKLLSADPGWDASLIVVGTGKTLPEWRAKAADAGLDRSIEFLGFRNDVPKILSACDLLVSPTRYEPYGLNVQEALACGLPAIVSADAGVAERYPPELADWLLNDPEDPAELAVRLRAWRDRTEACRALIRPLSDSLRRRTWDQTTAEMIARIERDDSSESADDSLKSALEPTPSVPTSQY